MQGPLPEGSGLQQEESGNLPTQQSDRLFYGAVYWILDITLLDLSNNTFRAPSTAAHMPLAIRHNVYL